MPPVTPARAEAWLLPDRLEPFDRFDLPGRTVRPVWLSLDIPATRSARRVRRHAARHCRETDSATLRLKIDVQQAVLPPPHEWTFRLDLWQNPWVIAWYYHVPPWSDEHKALLEAHLKLYADAGGKYITTYAVHSPVAGQLLHDRRRHDRVDQGEERLLEIRLPHLRRVRRACHGGRDRQGDHDLHAASRGPTAFVTWTSRRGNYVQETWPPESETFRHRVACLSRRPATASAAEGLAGARRISASTRTSCRPRWPPSR